jgi:hypothetical protein
MKDISKESALELGTRIATLLNVTPIGRDKFKTTLGVKETVGLGRLINTIYNDVERKEKKLVDKSK